MATTIPKIEHNVTVADEQKSRVLFGNLFENLNQIKVELGTKGLKLDLSDCPDEKLRKLHSSKLRLEYIAANNPTQSRIKNTVGTGYFLSQDIGNRIRTYAQLSKQDFTDLLSRTMKGVLTFSEKLKNEILPIFEPDSNTPWSTALLMLRELFEPSASR